MPCGRAASGLLPSLLFQVSLCVHVCVCMCVCVCVCVCVYVCMFMFMFMCTCVCVQSEAKLGYDKGHFVSVLFTHSSSITLLRLQRNLQAFEGLSKTPVKAAPPSAALMLVYRSDQSLLEASAMLLRDREPVSHLQPKLLAACLLPTPLLRWALVPLWNSCLQSVDTLAAIVDAEGRLVSVLTVPEAQRTVAGRRVSGGVEAGSRQLDRGLVCAETDSLTMLVTRLRHTRAPAMVVVDVDGRPQRVVTDTDVVLMFAQQPGWQSLFAARIWNDWLPQRDSPPALDETAGRRRSVSWSMQRTRTGSFGSLTPPSDAGSFFLRREGSDRESAAPGSPPRHVSLRSNSPWRVLAARIRSTLSTSS
jgi:hypothetical protein